MSELSSQSIPAGSPRPKRSSKRTIVIVIGAFLLFALIIWGVVSVATGRNWALGLGSQQSTTNLTKVRQAVEATPDVLSASVENGNSSGTPFGHSVRVMVLFDENKIPDGNRTALNQLTQTVEGNIRDAKIPDDYIVFYTPAKAGETTGSDRASLTIDAVETNKFTVK